MAGSYTDPKRALQSYDIQGARVIARNDLLMSIDSALDEEDLSCTSGRRNAVSRIEVSRWDTSNCIVASNLRFPEHGVYVFSTNPGFNAYYRQLVGTLTEAVPKQRDGGRWRYKAAEDLEEFKDFIRNCKPGGGDSCFDRVTFERWYGLTWALKAAKKGFSCKCHACDGCHASLEITLPELPPPLTDQSLQTLASDFKKLLFSTVSSDVTFVVGQESISAHQLVLSARVPYFERLFASGMKEGVSKVITIKDADAVSMKELLKFIYSGEPPKDLESCPETYLPLAEKYDMQDLKDSCSRAMARNLTSGNAVDTLIMADMFRCLELKSDCFRRLREWRTVVTDEALEPLKKFPELLLSLYRTP